jgi:hypothetical protein
VLRLQHGVCRLLVVGRARTAPVTETFPKEEQAMGKPNPTTRPQKRASVGKHGGNRAGDRNRQTERRSSQAAGRDPMRGKGR